MKAFYGFMLAAKKDLETNLVRFVPFFPFVRSSDILLNEPVEIDKAMQQMSTRWKEQNITDGVDITSYSYYCRHTNLQSDITGEPIGSKYLDAKCTYEFVKDGRVRVDVFASLDSTIENLEADRLKIEKTLYLPYGFKTAPSLVNVEYGPGNVDGISLAASIKDIQVTNGKLNPGFKNRGHYYSKIDLLGLFPKSGTEAASDFTAIYTTMDPVGLDKTYVDYIQKWMPLHITIQGWWK